jgi:DNA-binding IclR family transcriptional regulator
MLATLVGYGYARRNPDTGAYAIGYRALRLGSGVTRGLETLTSTVRPYVQSVQRVTRETTNLYAFQNDEVVLLGQILGGDDLQQFHRDPGIRVPGHATAAGKAYFAFTDRESVRRILEDRTLDRYTERTLIDSEDLMREFARIRARGFAVSREEYIEGMTCVAAPLFDHRNMVIGAISISDVTPNLSRLGDARELGELVGRAAMEASYALGYRGPSPWHEEPAFDSEPAAA